MQLVMVGADDCEADEEAVDDCDCAEEEEI